MNRTRWIPLVAVAGLLGVAMLAAIYANPRIESLPPELMPNPFGPTPPEPEKPEQQVGTASPLPDSGLAVPQWVTVLFTVLCLVTILAILAALLWTVLRDRLAERKAPLADGGGAAPTPAQTQERLRAAVDEGLLDLDDADTDPRRAVIACWVRLEEAAAAAGTPRQPGDTSTELVARLLSDHHISEAVLDGLAAIYREARFATHVVDAAMRDQARASLRQLRAELTARVGAP